MAADPYGFPTPAITLQSFPYRLKWTKAQVAEIMARKDRLADAMTDAVGPVGQVLGIDISIVHIMALHMALAGCEVHEELAYITAIIHRSQDGLPGGFHQWVEKSEYKPGPPPADETAAKAQAAADQIRRQLTPEVRAALVALMTTPPDETEASR